MIMAKVYATGRRKTAVAKVWLENGTGTLTINDQSLDQWLGGLEAIKKRVMQPLEVAKQSTSVNIKVKVMGSGYSAQAGAVRHGISRALVAFDEQFRTILKPYGLLTRDSRSVERKKYGRKKARRSPQFSKR
jgi:small subunit ribosomal protein S9